METVFNEIQHSVKNWWTSLLLGVVYIIVASNTPLPQPPKLRV